MATYTFDYTGDTQTWTVPEGVEAVTIEALGGEGAAGQNGQKNAAGDSGGRIVADSVPVTSGETLEIEVGGAASGDSGGYNGGGNGGSYNVYAIGGGGGGASDVRRGGSTLSDRIIVAGGGGGSANSDEDAAVGAGGYGGPNQAQDGADASTYDASASGGAGGTQSSGASVGNGGSGDLTGSGDTSSCASGGGGGGYYGGGGGQVDSHQNDFESTQFAAAGGGGGSNYATSNATISTNTGGANTGDGQVVISYTEPSTPTNVSATVDADDQITFSWDEGTDAGQSDEYDIDINRDGAGRVDPAGGPATVQNDGSTSYSATYGPHNSGGSAKTYNGSVGIDSGFEFRVRGSSSGGKSNWVSSGTVYTTPIPPHNPSINRPNSTDATFQFNTRSDIVSSVELEYRQDTGSGYGAWTTSASSPVTSGDTITLDADSRYHFRLRTIGPDGKVSDWVYPDYGNQNNVYFEDDFSSGDASAWNATSGSATVTDTLDSVYTAGDNTQTPETGGFAVEMGSDGYVEKSLGDLSGQSNVHVRVTVQMASNDTDSEHGDLWWYDGSTWQTLQQWGWEHDGQGWMEYHALVPDSYLATDNRVRVGRDEGGGVDYVAFDKVVVADLLDEYTTPAAPSALSLDASVDREISASWTVNAAFRDDSEVGVWPTGGSTDRWNESPTSLYTFTGLRDGEDYRVEINCAVHQYRHGTQQEEFDSSTIAGTALTNLPAPTAISIGSVTADTGAISWTDNHNYGDTRVEFKQSDAGSWTTFSTLSHGTEAETITGLLNGELYDTRVVATTEHTETVDQ